MNLIESFNEGTKTALMNHASSFLNVPPDQIEKALKLIAPFMFSKIAHTIDLSEENAKRFIIKASSLYSDLPEDINETFNNGVKSITNLMNHGSDILQMTFSNSNLDFIDQIATVSGLKGSATSVLIKMACPLLLVQLGKEAYQNNWKIEDLRQYLFSQKAFFETAITDEVELSALNQKITYKIDADMSYEEFSPNLYLLLKWIVPSLIILGLLGLIIT